MPTCGTIEVTPRFDTNNVSVSECAAGGDVTRGDTATVTATVENTNNTAANATVRLLVGGGSVGSATTRVAANSSRTVEFSVGTSGLSPGDYQVQAELTGAQRA